MRLQPHKALIQIGIANRVSDGVADSGPSSSERRSEGAPVNWFLTKLTEYAHIFAV
jgi:hypothetical protein